MTEAQLLTEYVEAASITTDVSRQVATLYVEMAVDSEASRTLDAVYVEVLTPARPRFVGWGTPV